MQLTGGYHDWRNEVVVPEHRQKVRYDRWYAWEFWGGVPDSFKRFLANAQAEGKAVAFRYRATPSDWAPPIVPAAYQPLYTQFFTEFAGTTVPLWVPRYRDQAFRDQYAAGLALMISTARASSVPVAWIDVDGLSKSGEANRLYGVVDAAGKAVAESVKPHYDDYQFVLALHMELAGPDIRLYAPTDDPKFVWQWLGASDQIGPRRDSLGWDMFHNDLVKQGTSEAIIERATTTGMIAEPAGWRSTRFNLDLFMRDVELYGVTSVGNGNFYRTWTDISQADQAKLLRAGQIMTGRTWPVLPPVAAADPMIAFGKQIAALEAQVEMHGANVAALSRLVGQFVDRGNATGELVTELIGDVAAVRDQITQLAARRYEIRAVD